VATGKTVIILFWSRNPVHLRTNPTVLLLRKMYASPPPSLKNLTSPLKYLLRNVYIRSPHISYPPPCINNERSLEIIIV
jgi:hypothetical protein